MLDFLLCEYISLGFRGGMCGRRTRARREREGRIFFYPAGIQTLRNAPLGTYLMQKLGMVVVTHLAASLQPLLEKGF